MMFDAETLEHFEDLLGDESSTNIPQDEGENIDDEETVINKLDANSLTLKDLLHEMEMRNLQPRGFFEDDAKLLQERLDKEHEEYLQSKRREKLEARELEASQAMIRRRKAFQEIELGEEERELESNQRVNEWFRIIKNRCPPTRCRIDVNNISARTLARLLWSDDVICSLDVSNMNISDSSGAYLARSLKNNSSIVRLEMSENFLGSKACATLADVLCYNNTLKYLSMESNPLTIKNGKDSIEALVRIIRENKSLIHLGLWRCNIGIEGGRKICEAMSSNEKITCLEVGYNFWGFADIQRIQYILTKNRAIHDVDRREELKGKAQERKRIRLEKMAQEEKLKKEMDLVYIVKEKSERAELRRKEIERLDEEARREEEKRRQDEELKILEQQYSKKSKKSKKKKKKKKK